VGDKLESAPHQSRELSADTRNLLLAITPALMIILGSKLVLIRHFGSVTPYWDQWDGDAALLYKPFIEGHLTFTELISSHNEHRIFFTRILDLVELELFGVWSPLLQMVVNALLHIATLTLFFWLLLRTLDSVGRVLVLLFAVFFFAVPFDWENTLSGFQSQFYFVFGFSVIALMLYQSAESFSLQWWAAIVLSAAAYFSMASGAMTVLAGFAVAALQMLLGVRARSRKEFAGLVLLAALFAVQLAFVRHVPGHEGAIDFVHALLETAGWPCPWPFALVINIPAVVLAATILRQRPDRTSYDWLLLMMFLWIGTQWLTLAYGRGVYPTAPRYADTLAIGPLLNIAAAWRLFGKALNGLALARTGALYRGRDGKRLLHPAATVAVLFAVAGVAVAGSVHPLDGAKLRGAGYVAQTANLRAFIRTGDMSHLQNKPFLSIPYPNPQRLASLASDSTIRSLLVPDLTSNPLRTDLLLPAWLTHLFRGGGDPSA
jgi:hypothetical protein